MLPQTVLAQTVLSIMRAWEKSPNRDIEVTWPEGRNGKTKAEIEWKVNTEKQGLQKPVHGKKRRWQKSKS